MNNSFTDDQILWLNDNNFNRNQINRLEALALNLNLDLDDVYGDIYQIIIGYPPEEPDFDVRISNEILLRLLEGPQPEYSLEDIQSLLEYGLMDEDFQWLLDNPDVLYEDIYHLLGAQWSFDEIKEYYDEPDDDDDEDDEGGGKRRETRRRKSRRIKTRRIKTIRRKTRRIKTRQRKQSKRKTRRRKH